MTITQQFLSELAAARLPLEKLAQLAANGEAEVQICKLCIRDPLNPEFIIGYQLVISVAGTLQLVNDVEQLVLKYATSLEKDKA